MPRARGHAPRVVRHLIGFEPGLFEHALGDVIGVGGGVGGEGVEGPAPRRSMKRRALFDGQLIGGDVLHAHRRDHTQFIGPAVQVLPRPGVDQVDGDPGEGALRLRDGVPRGAGVVIAAQRGEGLVVERLHPQRQAVHAGAGEGVEPRRLGVGGIGLQCDLQIVGWGPQIAGGVDHARRRRRIHQGRRAAAEEDRGQAPRSRYGRRSRHVGDDRLHERRLLLRPPTIAHHVEIAIGADARAVGPVHVDPEAWGPEAGRAGRRQNRAALSLAKARARWLMASLAAGAISPKVSSPPAGVKIGS